jgi:hypothetical protein
MRVSQQVLSAKKINVLSIFGRAVPFLLIFLPLIFSSFDAFGQEVSGANQNGSLEYYAKDVSSKTNVLVDVFNYIAFTSGIILIALGIQELRRHIESPQNTPLRQPLAKLGFGGILTSFPYILAVIADTMGASAFEPFKFVTINAFTFIAAGSGGNGSIGSLIANSVNNASVLIGVAAFAAFIIGVFFSLRGIQMLRAHIENPNNNPLPESLKRLAVGGALLSFPVIVNVVYETFGAFGRGIKNTGWSATAGGEGLDGMMVRFIGDISNTAYFGIEAFCYIAGTLMILFAMQRLVKTAQDGPRGPLGFGTIVMFIVSGLLLSFPQLLASLNVSIFNAGGVASTKASFMSLSGSVDAAQIQNAQSVFSAVLAFMAVIGFLSVVRGLFLLKAFADGNNQASMMSVCTHIVAGALAINLGGLINALQSSLGLTQFAVTFS